MVSTRRSRLMLVGAAVAAVVAVTAPGADGAHSHRRDLHHPSHSDQDGQVVEAGALSTTRLRIWHAHDKNEDAAVSEDSATEPTKQQLSIATAVQASSADAMAPSSVSSPMYLAIVGCVLAVAMVMAVMSRRKTRFPTDNLTTPVGSPVSGSEHNLDLDSDLDSDSCEEGWTPQTPDSLGNLSMSPTDSVASSDASSMCPVDTDHELASVASPEGAMSDAAL